MDSGHRRKKNGFTILEMLVVIAVIGILLTLLMPSLSNSKKKAASAVCMSNLSQIYTGLVVYSKHYNGRFPPSSAELGVGGIAALCKVNASKQKFQWRNYGFAFGEGILDTPDIFYCPLWEHPFWQRNEYDPSDRKQAGIQDDTTVDVVYYKASYTYRSWLSDGRPPSPVYGDPDDPVLADFWTEEVWQYSHEGREYNVAYLGGAVKHIDDSSMTIGPNAPHRTKHNKLKTKWDIFFKK